MAEAGRKTQKLRWVRALPALAESAAARLGGDRAPRRMPTSTGPWTVLAVLLGMPVGLKLVKGYALTEGHAGIVDLALVTMSDVGVALASAAVALLLAGVLGRRRRGAVIFWSLVTVYLACVLGLNALEHQAWVRSGSLLDWSIFWYTIEHFADLRIVIAAETTPGGLALLGIGAGLALLPLAADAVGAKLLRRGRAPRPRVAAGLAIAAVPCLIVSARPPEAPELHPITQSAAFGLFAGAFSAAAEQALEAQPKFTPPSDEDQHARIEKILDAAHLERKPGGGRPKNVLLVVLESTRFDATSLYVPSLDTTPHMQELAKHGVVAERMYVDMPHTSKALVSILCGYEPRFSVEVTEAEPGGLPGPCLAQVLSRFGHASAFFQAATGSYENRHQLANNMGYGDVFTRESYDETGFEETNYLSVEDKIMVEPVMRWIDRESEGGMPFFVTMLTCISHHGYGVPSDFDVKRYRRRPTRIGGRMPRPWSEFNSYLNTVRYADEMIDELAAGLKKRKLLDDTLIVVVGDHGQAFQEHGQKAHNTVIWEEGLRVPFLMHNRRLFDSGVRVKGLRRQVDIVPSVLAALGIKHDPVLFSGRDLLTSEGHDSAISSCWYDKRCMAETRDHIRIIDHFDNQPMEVFDLEADPFERRNLLLHRDKALRERWQGEAEQARARMKRHVAALAKHHDGAADPARPWILPSEPHPGHVVRARLGQQVELLGYDTPTLHVRPGGFWDVVIYFKCLERSERGWRFFGRLETTDGRSHQKDHHPAQGRMYLHECDPGTIVADHLRVWVPDDFPPGDVSFYWGSVFLEELGHVRQTNRRKDKRAVAPLTRGVLVKDRGVRLAVLDVQPEYTEELASLMARNVTNEAPQGGLERPVRFGNAVSLIDVKLEPAEVRRMASAKVTTTWQVNERLPGPYQIFVHLEHEGRYRRHRTHTPLDGIHPVANWQPGTWVTDTHTIPIGRNMPLGEAQVWVGLSYAWRRLKITDEGSATVASRRVLAGTIQIVR